MKKPSTTGQVILFTLNAQNRQIRGARADWRLIGAEEEKAGQERRCGQHFLPDNEKELKY